MRRAAPFSTTRRGAPFYTTHLLIYFSLYIDSVQCSAKEISPLGNSDHVVVLVSIDLTLDSLKDASLQYTAFDYTRAKFFTHRTVNNGATL